MCALTGRAWNMTQQEIDGYRRFGLPPSRYHPETRWMILNQFGTGYQWWWNRHWKTGEPLLSFHHPASGFRVLPEKEWFDMDFANNKTTWDPSRSFFEQYAAMARQLPQTATGTLITPENSIAFSSLGDKNSYFVTGSRSKNSFYSVLLLDGENSSEVWASSHISKSYQILHCERMHQCRFARESHDCLSSSFLFDCRNSEFCFGATNKRNRKYIWMNEQLSREEYEKRLSAVDLGSRKNQAYWLSQFEALLRGKTIWPENFNENSDTSTGEYLHGATDCKFCMDFLGSAARNNWVYIGLGQSENNAFCIAVKDASDSYFCRTVVSSANMKMCGHCVNSDSLKYCYNCYDCQDCFGCFGLRNKKYHVFNRPYEKEEYFRLIDEIKCSMLERGEYGEFFPLSLATGYVPYSWGVTFGSATAEHLVKYGQPLFGVCDDGACGVEKEMKGDGMKTTDEIPDSIDEISDDWIGVPIWDPTFKRKFSFLRPEVEFYREERIAPPDRHFIRRVLEMPRVGQTIMFEDRTCEKCSKKVLTTKNLTYPDRVIYCRACYLKYLEQYG